MEVIVIDDDDNMLFQTSKETPSHGSVKEILVDITEDDDNKNVTETSTAGKKTLVSVKHEKSECIIDLTSEADLSLSDNNSDVRSQPTSPVPKPVDNHPCQMSCERTSSTSFFSRQLSSKLLEKVEPDTQGSAKRSKGNSQEKIDRTESVCIQVATERTRILEASTLRESNVADGSCMKEATSYLKILKGSDERENPRKSAIKAASSYVSALNSSGATPELISEFKKSVCTQASEISSLDRTLSRNKESFQESSIREAASFISVLKSADDKIKLKESTGGASSYVSVLSNIGACADDKEHPEERSKTVQSTISVLNNHGFEEHVNRALGQEQVAKHFSPTDNTRIEDALRSGDTRLLRNIVNG